MTRTFAIVSTKGGILKTSLCINIGGELSKKHRVLLIDTDSQSNVSNSFGIEKTEIKKTLFDCLTNNVNPDDAILNVSKNLDIIPSGKAMDNYIKKDNRSTSDLRNLIQSIKSRYDYIILDNKPSMNFPTLQSLMASDEVIIPFEAEGYGMLSILDTLKSFQEIKNKIDKDIIINNIVVTKFDTRSKVHKKFFEDIKTASARLKIPLARTKISLTTTGAKSILEEQKPPVLSKKWYRLQGIYSYLTREIIE